MKLSKLREIAMAATQGQWYNDSYTQIASTSEVILSLKCEAANREKGLVYFNKESIEKLETTLAALTEAK